MPKRVTLEKIEKEADTLTPDDQLRLIEKLVYRLRRIELVRKRELDWTKLYGMGKGLWNDEDGQEYVNRLREDRT